MVINADTEINVTDTDDKETVIDIDNTSSSNIATQVGQSFMDQVELLCEKEEDECYDFQDEGFNFEQLLFYSRD